MISVREKQRCRGLILVIYYILVFIQFGSSAQYLGFFFVFSPNPTFIPHPHEDILCSPQNAVNVLMSVLSILLTWFISYRSAKILTYISHLIFFYIINCNKGQDSWKLCVIIVFSSAVLLLSVLPFYKFILWMEAGSFRKNIPPDQCVELWFCQESLVNGLLFGYSCCYRMLSVVMLLPWSVYRTNGDRLSTPRSRSRAFQENRGADKVMKINPGITGNLTERNQIHEMYLCPLWSHTKTTECSSLASSVHF